MIIDLVDLSVASEINILEGGLLRIKTEFLTFDAGGENIDVFFDGKNLSDCENTLSAIFICGWANYTDEVKTKISQLSSIFGVEYEDGSLILKNSPATGVNISKVALASQCIQKYICENYPVRS